jgi:hypothetical protein
MRSRAALVLSLVLIGCHYNKGGGAGSSTGLVAVPPNEAFLPNAVAGTAYTETFTFTGGGTPLTITAPSGTPAGLTFNAGTSSAVLTGNPTTPATGSFEIQVVNGSGQVVTLTYALRILPSSAGLSLSPTTLPNGIKAVTYDQTLTVSGGTAPFTWTTISGSLPPGLTLSTSTSSSNAITGAPTTSGTFPFTIQITDSSSPVQTGTFALTITVN